MCGDKAKGNDMKDILEKIRKLCTDAGLRCKQKIPPLWLPPSAIVAQSTSTPFRVVMILAQTKPVLYGATYLKRNSLFHVFDKGANCSVNLSPRVCFPLHPSPTPEYPVSEYIAL